MLLGEFLGFAVAEFGGDVAERLMPAEQGGSGRWNPVGAYPHEELLELAARLGKLTGSDAADLLRGYGARLFHRLAALYPGFLIGAGAAFPFIARFQSAIHDELRKLHPGSEVPQIDCTAHGDDHLEMVYRSPRRLGDLAEGLLLGCIEHFGEPIEIRRLDLAAEAGQIVVFTLLRHEARAAV